MKKPEMPSNEEIIKKYLLVGSIKATALYFEISAQKVRRVLLLHEKLSTPRGDQIKALANQGMSITEIAEKIHITENAVSVYLPYQKCEYRKKNPSDNARRIRRSREKTAEDRLLAQGKNKYLGVSYNKRTGKYIAYCTISGKRWVKTNYLTAEDAKAAREAKLKEAQS